MLPAKMILLTDKNDSKTIVVPAQHSYPLDVTVLTDTKNSTNVPSVSKKEKEKDLKSYDFSFPNYRDYNKDIFQNP